MTRTLYAGRLWFEATEIELKDWFGHLGPIEAVAISEDREPDPTDEPGTRIMGVDDRRSPTLSRPRVVGRSPIT